MPDALSGALDAAAKPLRKLLASLDAEGEDRGAAGVLTGALEDLERRREQGKGADLLTRWTATRAAATLRDAGIAAIEEGGVAIVSLPAGRLEVLPAATEEAVAGYAVRHRTAGGELVARYRAADNPTLARIAAELLAATQNV
jgi:hypothetical protein